MENLIPFEIHITISDLTINRQSDFIDFCFKNEAKPLLIELAQGRFLKQPMLSKIVYSNGLDSVLAIAYEISISLSNLNYKVERMKIEIPANKSHLFQSFTSAFSKYFEWHCKIEYFQLPELTTLCEKHKVHLSLNSLKNEENKRFITLREFGNKMDFENRVNMLILDLKKGNWTIYKQEAEYCVYDNNTFLDTEWLPQ